MSTNASVAARRVFCALASHNLALALIGVLGLVVVAGGTLPQIGRLASADLLAFRNQWPTSAAWMDYLGLSAIFSSNWFLLLCIALLVNIIAGTILSFQRRLRLFQGQTKPSFILSGRGTFPSIYPPLLGADKAASMTYGRFGLLGLPLFHLGIAVVIVGGLWSSWVGFAAHLELSEGEVFAGKKDKLMVERSAVEPPAFDGLLRLDQVQVELHKGKYLSELKAHFSMQREGGQVEQVVVESNRPLAFGGYRIYPDNTMGYSALFERIRTDGKKSLLYINFPILRSEWDQPPPLTHRVLVELENRPFLYQMTLQVAEHPTLSLKVREGADLVFDGVLRPGLTADLGPYRLIFREVVPWLGFYLARNHPMYLVFAGFLLVLVGFAMHLVIRFRRVEMIVGDDGWEVRAWAMVHDWRYREQWDNWQKQIQAIGTETA